MSPLIYLLLCFRYGLTGTPLQNKLEEFWCVLDWANPGSLGPSKKFNKEFGKPIRKGQPYNATKRELAVGRKSKWIIAWPAVKQFRYCRGRNNPAIGCKGASNLSNPEKWIGLSGCCMVSAQVVWAEFFALYCWLREFSDSLKLYTVCQQQQQALKDFAEISFAQSGDQLKVLALCYLCYHQKPREKLCAMKWWHKCAVLWEMGKEGWFGWCYESSQNISRTFPEAWWFFTFRIQRSSI